MAIKGLKDLHYAIITEENENETVYGEIKPFGPAMALNLQPTINRANFELTMVCYLVIALKELLLYQSIQLI